MIQAGLSGNGSRTRSRWQLTSRPRDQAEPQPRLRQRLKVLAAGCTPAPMARIRS
jgi:hypothetical protein